MKHSFCAVAVATLFVGFGLNGTETKSKSWWQKTVVSSDSNDFNEKYKEESFFNKFIQGAVQEEHYKKNEEVPQNKHKISGIEEHLDNKPMQQKVKFLKGEDGKFKTTEHNTTYDMEKKVAKENFVICKRGGMNPERMIVTGFVLGAYFFRKPIGDFISWSTGKLFSFVEYVSGSKEKDDEASK